MSYVLICRGKVWPYHYEIEFLKALGLTDEAMEDIEAVRHTIKEYNEDCIKNKSNRDKVKVKRVWFKKKNRRLKISIDIKTKNILKDMVLEIKQLRFEVLHVKFAIENKKIEDGLALICPHCEKVFYISEEEKTIKVK